MKILVVKRELLLKNYYFQGFVNAEINNFLDLILKNGEWLSREEAEKDQRYKQPIPYGIILNSTNKILLYKRGKKEYKEKRLIDKYSIGIGGHIEKVDLNERINIVLSTLLREIEEEISLNEKQIESVKLIGYINDDSNEVGKVHFGIVYLVKIDLQSIIPNDKEIEFAEFMNLEEIQKYSHNLENWSLLCYNFLKERAR